MSGRHKFSKLRERIESDPVRRARTEQTNRIYDKLIAAAHAGLSDEELDELAWKRLPDISEAPKETGV